MILAEPQSKSFTGILEATRARNFPGLQILCKVYLAFGEKWNCAGGIGVGGCSGLIAGAPRTERALEEKATMLLKRAIRDLDTGLFFCRGGRWARDGRLSQDFADPQSAMREVERYNIKNADLVTVNEQGYAMGGAPLRIAK